MTVRFSSLAALVFAIVATAPAFAANIPLYNTGVDNSGNPLANGAIDTHYTLLGYDATRAADASNGYPIGPGSATTASPPGSGHRATAYSTAPLVLRIISLASRSPPASTPR